MKPAWELRLMILPEPWRIDDAADHLAGEEEALDVRVEGQVVVGLADVLGRLFGRPQAGVVDEDVDAPQGRHDGVGS